ncbi:8-amino-7-oxononanoate synthase [Rhodoplanes sp. TEM]|uniref:8-amino-7-ketopelargonate synthase n=1 Tax=Rhodoplanes tepidamans TaxID=200616 RepID=A0ABT5JAZ4_RHOTP|nr:MULTISPECIES: 8-amino-7-oxononanoate synthase [Rhodoplanes]MDC7786454.1 8-amino-7-oxononanoate synthase [Rhodoplanes tepidamans]MDC7985096.1 8-amino-7-oxononanoate synthase [Rhodoplanes sp. TEM]MDQ0357339.1 8-amino-7-oxononanoate synthase [Rhodoplanes tepidamans]
MTSLDAFATAKLDALAAQSLRRTLVHTARAPGVVVERDGRRYLSFSCNDYLNLSHHPAVLAAAHAALDLYGIGSGASRLVTGNHPLYGALEERLARLKGAEACCVFGSGYLTNTGVIPALAGPGDLIVVDEWAHACIMAGSRMSGATVQVFRHNDVGHAGELLAAHRGAHRNALLLTDGVFSMDGDLAPLPALGRLAKEHDTWLMADDAHGIGVLAGGRGSTYAFDEPADVPLQMGTLSKAIGAYGGYLCASRPVVELMKSRARTLVYSTGLPPPVVAAAIAAIDLIEADPRLAEAPIDKARLFTRRVGLPDPQSPIVPVLVGEAEAALAASRMLAEEGFLVVAIRPPTVPPGTARLRLTFTPAHPDQDIERLADLVRDRVLGNVP